MNLALFDFDGTITTKDTLIDFILYSFGKVKFIIGITLSFPHLVLFKMKIIANWNAKERFMKFFFKGADVDSIHESGKVYAKNVIPDIIRPEAQKQIDFHKKNGDKIFIVTASPDIWIKPWAEQHGITVIATRLAVIDNKLTSKIAGKNCHGQEKVNRIKEVINIEDYDKIYAYGDSSGDTQMLAIADVKYFRWKKL